MHHPLARPGWPHTPPRAPEPDSVPITPSPICTHLHDDRSFPCERPIAPELALHRFGRLDLGPPRGRPRRNTTDLCTLLCQLSHQRNQIPFRMLRALDLVLLLSFSRLQGPFQPTDRARNIVTNACRRRTLVFINPISSVIECAPRLVDGLAHRTMS